MNEALTILTQFLLDPVNIAFCVAISVLTQAAKKLLKKIPAAQTHKELTSALLPLLPYIFAFSLWPVAGISLSFSLCIYYGFVSEHIFRIFKAILRSKKTWQ